MTHRGSLLSMLLGTLLVGSAAAQDAQPVMDPAVTAWGTQDVSVLNISAWGFMPAASAYDYFYFTNSGRLGGQEGGVFRSPLILPSGAQILQVVAEGCDEDPANDLHVSLQRCPLQQEGCITLGRFTANTSDSPPGCVLFASEENAHTVQNLANTYFLHVLFAGTDQSLRSVRVLYKLQPSPAPSTATFADVPTTDPFFRYVEALSRSGITAGCGDGNFCPNAPLTRGQMAVFLTKALGLHWPL